MTVTMQVPDRSGQGNEELSMCIRFLKVDDVIVCVEF